MIDVKQCYCGQSDYHLKNKTIMFRHIYFQNNDNFKKSMETQFRSRRIAKNLLFENISSSGDDLNEAILRKF